MNWLKKLFTRTRIPIDSVALLSVKPGDVLVFKIDEPLSVQTYERITVKVNEFCKDSFPFDVKAIVITGGLELQTVRPTEAA